ncbi:hypothetical protein F4780DRAFT_725837 [Xylariomycetidae sp. FL0641]|nr:hypothetical protein F4780DRAFT_725837 [Xylariomycetidae sp. FL0641]
MAAPSPLPSYVYKIVPEEPPTPLPETYPLSDLDRQDGFIHLSTATQVPKTADLFFAAPRRLWVLKLGFGARPAWHARTTWEAPGCPHLHLHLHPARDGGRREGGFGAADIAGVGEFARAEGEGWADAMRRQDAGGRFFEA